MKTTHFIQSTLPVGRKVIYFLGFFLLLFIGTAQTISANELDGLAEYIQTALEQNYEIRAAQSRLAESTEKIRQTGVLPDPKLGAQYFIEPIETRTGPQEASISLSQSIPWPGRLSLAKNLQEHNVNITRVELQAARLAVIRKVKEAYVEYGYLGQAEKIAEQTLELMLYLEGIARTNYTSGKSSYADVLKIQIEIDRLKNRKISLKDSGLPARVSINSLLGTERDHARRQPEEIPQVELTLDEEHIYKVAHENSPKLAVAQYKLAMSKTHLDIADLGFYPDFTLNLKTIFTGDAEFGNPPDSGQDPVIVGFGMTLPVYYGKRKADRAEKLASVQAARHGQEQTFNNLAIQIENLLFRYREAERLLHLYTDSLIPKIRQELDVALESFQAGQHSILELIDAEKNWLTFELNRIRAQADMAIQVARLEELIGATLVNWNQHT